MPKPIKRKVVKKAITQEEIKNSYDRIKDYIEQNYKRLLIYAGVVILVILVISVGLLYRRYTYNKAKALTYSAYKAFYNLYQDENMTEEERIISAINDFKKAYNYRKSAINLYYMANGYFAIANIEEAEKTLQKIINEFPGENEVVSFSHYRLYKMYKERGDEENALNSLKALYSLRSQFYKDVALIKWADILLKKGEKEEAKKKLKELTMNYPSSPYFNDAVLKLKPLVETGKDKENDKGKDTKKEPALEKEP